MTKREKNIAKLIKTIGVVVDKLDRLLQCVNAQNAKNRSEDLLFVRLNDNVQW